MSHTLTQTESHTHTHTVFTLTRCVSVASQKHRKTLRERTRNVDEGDKAIGATTKEKLQHIHILSSILAGLVITHWESAGSNASVWVCTCHVSYPVNSPVFKLWKFAVLLKIHSKEDYSVYTRNWNSNLEYLNMNNFKNWVQLFIFQQNRHIAVGNAIILHFLMP